MSEAIRFYCGIGEQQWNHHEVAPGPYACISPVYGRDVEALPSRRLNRVKVPIGVQVIQDSGAFSDGPTQRLSVEEALERQISHAERYGYASQVTHRASYDLLIDEKWENGQRYKSRWTEADAEIACTITIKAAAYISKHRQGLGAILSAQGVSAQQYLRCTEQIVPYMQRGDLFGLGGFCITGLFPRQFLPVFKETMHLVIPFLAKEQVQRVHVWGVCFAPALAELLWLCDQHGISLSTDSMGPSIRPCRGKWGYWSWVNRRYIKPCSQEIGLHRKIHVYLTRRWLRDFRTREKSLYRSTWQPRPKQMFLMEAV